MPVQKAKVVYPAVQAAANFNATVVVFRRDGEHCSAQVNVGEAGEALKVQLADLAVWALPAHFSF
ncbi:hypothetical protein SDC9_169616 [bioreactor metagenome]|uniref:Uncharacterized protein n=1 Tax=bioreactor metagenome TaxID=1076179 RepID=A0A645GEL0_9ZZZZ